ncbi:hypothetical protein Bca52824_007874 [Brassica carinata]|uniref:Uncharacterized protein n=1 Tax=Brassica carinata TaxID=52824 RepID=A0A8X7W7Y2_BRACI|nr:hypothetical protein Bca52824_007874 [Brassica carinata]
MARLTVTVTLLLFTLAISVVSSKPENEIIADSHKTLSAESDPFATNPTTLHESGSSEPELTSSDEITLPVNFMNFHPINRHFPRRPLTFNRRPCHHRRHEMFGRGLQIPYGNDMIFSSGDEEKATAGADPSLDSIVVDIPAIKMFVGPVAVEETKQHVEAEDDGSSSMKITVTLTKRKEEGEGERENLFRTKIRKFLNHLV